MGRARLTRIEAVQEMAAAVDAFRSEAIAALEGLDMDIRRALEWIHNDRREHWNSEVRRGWDRITQARLQLQQARTARRVGEHEPACPDEKKALERAKRRLETAQEKVDAVRHCARAIDEAVNDYRGAKTPLASWLESEAPKALAALRRMMDNLETYVAMQAPSGAAGTSVPLPPGAAEVHSTQYSVPSPREGGPATVQQSAATGSTQRPAADSSENGPEQSGPTPATSTTEHSVLSTEYCVLDADARASTPGHQPPTQSTVAPSNPAGGPA